jgi:lysozyme
MDIVEQLKRDEGEKKENGVHAPYRDHLGFLTIGYGHNLDAKGVSERVAEVMLEDDISDAKAGLMGRWPWMRDLSPARLGAFVNLAFNMGVGSEKGKKGLAGFKKALAAAEAGDWDTCAKEVMDSDYAPQVGPRAHRVAQQLREDRWV